MVLLSFWPQFMHGVHRIIVKHENYSLSNKDIEIMKDRLESMHYL